MCYHVSTPGSTDLRVKTDKNVLYTGDEIFHVSGFDTPFLPVTLNNNADIIIPARWRFLPYWVKSDADLKKAGNTLNAIGEEIFEKNTYKRDILTHRGLLYVNGFFEPHKVPGQKESENYYIYYPNKEIFTLGVVYTMFKDFNTDQVYPTFSILTTPANPLLENIHNEKKRMPLIIPETKRDNWLFAEGKEEIQQLIIPFEGELGAHRTFRVTSARGVDTNRPDIQDAI
ncbi:SOS response-associated peptidase [Sphingobacterium thalpophilum]|uniref:SOS response-associated peptidase n=1 Tax=Sphingobacterium thalpophilum TaxID=259 RepID=UPI003D96B3A0